MYTDLKPSYSEEIFDVDQEAITNRGRDTSLVEKVTSESVIQNKSSMDPSETIKEMEDVLVRYSFVLNMVT